MLLTCQYNITHVKVATYTVIGANIFDCACVYLFIPVTYVICSRKLLFMYVK